MAKSYSQLVKERDHLNELIESARKREAEGVIKRIREAITVYGITADDLYGKAKPRAQATAKVQTKARARVPVSKRRAAKKHQPTPKGSKRPVKYADSNGNKWAGGGSQPVWLREQLKQGRKLEDFLVKNAA
jgi:DNA-binding protein H-NS